MPEGAGNDRKDLGDAALPEGEAGPPNHHDDKGDVSPEGGIVLPVEEELQEGGGGEGGGGEWAVSTIESGGQPDAE